MRFTSIGHTQQPYPNTAHDGGAYMAHVAARAIFVIRADEPVIGLTAFVAIGMSEVSSWMIDPKVEPGYHIATQPPGPVGALTTERL